MKKDMIEERIDVGDGLTVDLAPHRRLGMTILTKDDIDRRRRVQEVVKGSDDMEAASRQLCDENLVVSRSEGRRLWQGIRSSGTKNGLHKRVGDAS